MYVLRSEISAFGEMFPAREKSNNISVLSYHRVFATSRTPL